MARAIRLLLTAAVALVPLLAGVGCDPKADNTPNSSLGAPPTIPPGRGAGEGGGGGGPVDPKAPKAPKK